MRASSEALVAEAYVSAAPVSRLPAEWSFKYGEHVVSGALVVRDVAVEAQILLDGTFIYGSRHATRDVAAKELEALRGGCADWLLEAAS